MKVLLTGANGYVGSYLIGALMSAGFSVTTLTRKSHLREGTVNFVVDEYCPAAVSPCLVGQDVVIHLAGLAHQISKNKDAAEALYMRVNVEQTLMLAREAKKAGIKRFIFMSSIKVNGESTTAGVPFRADMIPAPEDAYGRSKWAAEQALSALFEGSHTELVIIRPPLIWGGEAKGNLRLLQKLVALRIPLPIGRINNRRDLVSLKNLSSFICVLIGHPGAAAQTFLVSDGVARNLAQIVQLSANQGVAPWIVNCPVWIIGKLARISGLEKRLTGNLEVDIQPACESLGWAPGA